MSKIQLTPKASQADKGECRLSKRNKSKRFIQKSVDAIQKHDERIPYHMTYAEAEQRKAEKADHSSLGGF
jgi:hypothetical protein